ncbi:flavin reductase CtcQ [Kitasatospora sp. NPDC056783]|uniref:flavin reductase CtcQ n=1 Tax=Kitasatospora sp. NPDC056783 TaxID=3345943 RepID=UPI0036737D4B
MSPVPVPVPVPVSLPLDLPPGLVDGPTFLSIMGALPTGVTVVTTLDQDGEPCGLTCSAACSVSKTPPLLLVCVNRDSRVLKALLERGEFAVNVLRGGGEATSARFASPVEDRFRGVRWEPGSAGGLPVMPADVVAHAECRVAAAVEAGDHTIVIGAVLAGGPRPGVSGPLMYWRRSYARWPVEEDPGTTALTLAAEG